MFYAQEVIDEVLSRNDIVDVISSYLGNLKRSGSNYTCCCPFHSEKTPSFSVSRQKQIFHCFGCHEGGNAISFIMKYEHYSFAEALKILADRVGYVLPEVELSNEEKRDMDRKSRLREVNTAAAAYFHFLLTKSGRGKTGYAYFREKRRFTDETIAKFGLGYADVYADDLYKYLKNKGFPDELMRDAGLVEFSERHGPQDKFWNRVMVPILDLQGKCIAFGGRVLGDGKPKYMNTKETELFDKSRNLFALNIARRSKRRGMILCEGYMDVITQHQEGFDNAIASLGTAFTEGQASLIRRYTKEVYLAYDSDTAGKTAAKKAIRLLRSMGMSQRVIDLSPCKDPDEFLAAYGAEAYEERIRDAVPGRMFEIREMSGGYRLDDPEEKASFIRQAAVSIAGIENVAERSSYVDTVSRKYMLDKNVLQQEVTRVGMMGLQDRASPEPEDEALSGTRDQRQNERAAVKPPPQQETQEILLTWMVNRPGYFGKLMEILEPEDFSGAAREVLEELIKQYREDGILRPALIIGKYNEEDQHSRIATMLSSEFPFEADRAAEEKALTELVRKIKTEREDAAIRRGEGSSIEHARKKKDIQKLTIHF